VLWRSNYITQHGLHSSTFCSPKKKNDLALEPFPKITLLKFGKWVFLHLETFRNLEKSILNFQTAQGYLKAALQTCPMPNTICYTYMFSCMKFPKVIYMWSVNDDDDDGIRFHPPLIFLICKDIRLKLSLLKEQPMIYLISRNYSVSPIS